MESATVKCLTLLASLIAILSTSQVNTSEPKADWVPGLMDDTHFLFSDVRATYGGAEVNCKTAGGYLASVTDGRENLLIQQQIQNRPNEQFETASRWIGLKLITFSDTNQTRWTWLSNETSTFRNWRNTTHAEAMESTSAAQPDCACAEMNRDDGKWQPITCAEERRFVCKKLYLNEVEDSNSHARVVGALVLVAAFILITISVVVFLAYKKRCFARNQPHERLIWNEDLDQPYRL